MRESDLLSRIRRAIILSDPGALRLTQAAKTVAAVILIILAHRQLSHGSSFFAAMCTAFLMQCWAAGSRRFQQATMTVAAAAMAVLAMLGTALSTERWGREALVVATAFLTYYSRRWLPDLNWFPVFLFTTTLLSTVLPGDWVERGLSIVGGFGASMLIFFYVFPRDIRHAYVASLDQFADLTADFVRTTARLLDRPQPSIPQQVTRLYENASFRQGVWAALPAEHRSPILYGMLVHQYELLQALSVLEECCTALAQGSLNKTVHDQLRAAIEAEAEFWQQPLSPVSTELLEGAQRTLSQARPLTCNHLQAINATAMLCRLRRLHQTLTDLRAQWSQEKSR